MKAEIVNVTPQMASDWLKFNTDNRPLRRSVVDGFKYAMTRGEYITTHQGIAFSEDGVLLDGQHRLTAISELRDGAFPMLVTWGVSKDAFKVMDIGIRRTAADALKEDRRLVEVARLIAVICMERKTGVTPTSLIPIIERIQDVHVSLLEFCPSAVRTWSSAPVRTAAVCAIMSGTDDDYVKAVYRAIVLSNFNAMPSVARALYKSVINGSVSAAGQSDLLSRCLVVFNPAKANNTKIQVKSSIPAYALVRSLFGDIAKPDDSDAQKKAAPVSAARNVSAFNYTRKSA